jgi:hypothetical protein
VTTVSLTLHGDPDEVDIQARQLRIELLALDVDRVDLAAQDEPPPLSKGVDPATFSTIIVAMSSSPVLVRLGRVLRDWVNRSIKRKIVVRDGDRSLEITGTRT